MRYILVHQEARQRALEAVRTAPDGVVVDIKPMTRTRAQNDAQWPILKAFSLQVQWPVNGSLTWLDPEDWKNILTAAYRKETTRVAQGWDGGMVLLGMRTSKMDKRQFSEWLDWLNAAAAMKEVKV